MTTHGEARPGKRTSTYRTWESLRGRCLNENDDHYADYGGRGIRVCERWANSFENFLADMGERPEGKTIDRVDNDGDYTPENCRWATPVEQRANQRYRPTRFIEFRGERLSVPEWAKRLGLSPSTINRRFQRGLSTAEILSAS